MATFTHGLRITKRRLIPGAFLVLLLGTLFLLPADTEPWVFAAAGALAALIALFLMGDRLVDLWLRRNIGTGAGPGDFLREEWHRLGSGVAFILAALCVLLAFRVPLGEGGDQVLLITAGGLFGAGVLARLVRAAVPGKKDAGDDPLKEVAGRAPVSTLSKDIAEARAFGRVCGMRIMGPLIGLWLFTWLLFLVAMALCAGLWVLGWSLTGSAAVLADPERWPLLAKMGFLGAIILGSVILCTSAVGTFRVVARMRRVGRLRKGEVGRELGNALETVGVIGTAGYGFAMCFVLLLLSVAEYGVADVIAQAGSIPFTAALPVGAVVMLAPTWVLLVWPQLYLFAVLAGRDCGWMRAFEVSLELAMLDKRDSLLRALVATAYAVTIVGIPVAVDLLLEGLAARQLLVATILGEKTKAELVRALDEEERESPVFLQKFFDLLNQGRYLDALNGFQMHLMKDPEFVPALRGAAMALLRMGNPNARELLERWERLDPEDAEVATLLIELRDGRWSEKGDLYQDAVRKCTQHIGRGV